MMKFRVICVAAIAIALTGCQQTTSGGDRPGGPDSCDTSLLEFIGQPVSQVNIPPSRNYRVIRPGDIVSLDLNPRRTNVGLDINDTIQSVYCG